MKVAGFRNQFKADVGNFLVKTLDKSTVANHLWRRDASRRYK
jgi:hypothetical protein